MDPVIRDLNRYMEEQDKQFRREIMEEEIAEEILNGGYYEGKTLWGISDVTLEIYSSHDMAEKFEEALEEAYKGSPVALKNILFETAKGIAAEIVDRKEHDE